MLVSLCLLSEDTGGKTGILFEKINKVIDIVVTDFAAYLMDGPICGKQHFFCFFETLSDEIFEGRHTVSGRKLPAETVLADMEKLFEFVERKLSVILMLQKIIKFYKIAGNLIMSSSVRRIKKKTGSAQNLCEMLVHEKNIGSVCGCRDRQKRMKAPLDKRILGDLKHAAEAGKNKAVQFQIPAIYKKEHEIPWKDKGVERKGMIAVDKRDGSVCDR